MTPRLLPVLAAAALLAGCLQKNASSIQAGAICSMPDNCAFNGSCSAQSLDTVTVDVLGATELNIALEIDNNLPSNQDDYSHLNTNDADIRHAHMTYSSDTFQLTPQTQDISSWVNAESTTVLWFYPLTPEALAEIRAAGVPAYDPFDPTTLLHVTANVTFSGNLADGSAFKIEPKPIPITVCSGCLPVAACDDPAQVRTACGGMYQLPRGASGCVTPGGDLTTFQIGGRVYGLNGTGLQVTCGNAGTATIDSDGTGDQAFSLPAPLVDGTQYNCIISDSQTNPAQTCTFRNNSGTGTVSGGIVTTLVIDCI